jgi:hypothetical protein
MAATHCIKGSVYSAAVEDVNKIFANGELSRDQAKRWLEESDFQLLARSIGVASWFDIRSYDRLNRLLRDVEGGGRNEYLREKGRETARRLLAMGLYSQFEYLQRATFAKTEGAAERFAAFGRDLARLSTLSASILNFSKWKAHPDPDVDRRYVIEVTEAGDFPETLAWRSDGLVNEMASQHGVDDLWLWRRERPDVIVFRMTREI